MGRPSMFSFPLSGKKARPYTTNTYPRNDQHLSKAERLLGTTGLGTPHSPRHQLRPSLSTHQRSRSSQFALQDADDEFDSDIDSLMSPSSIISPTCIGDVVIPPRHGSLGHIASTDVSEETRNHKCLQSGSYATGHTRQTRDSRSSLTLRSYYDAKNLPLQVTQQTSESAIRDRALRKEQAPATEGTHGFRMQHAMRPDLATRHGVDNKTTRRKKRPVMLDLSRLFPKSIRSSDKLGSQLSPDSHTSEYFPHPERSMRKHSSASTNMTRKSGTYPERVRVVAKPVSQSYEEYQRRSIGNEYEQVKNHVRRPPRGAQNWFDGVLEEEDERDFEMEQEMPSLTTELFSPSSAGRHSHDAFAQSFTDPSDLAHAPSTVCPQASNFSNFSDFVPHSLTTPYSPKSSRSARTKESKFDSSVLGDVSVLSTSSSEEDLSGAESIDPRLPRMRDSIQMSEINSIHVGKARAFDPRRGRKAVVTDDHGRRMSDESSHSAQSASMLDNSSLRSSTNDSAYLTVPHGVRPRKSGHTRQPSSIPEDSDVEPLQTKYFKPRPSSIGTRSLQFSQPEPRQLMAVTEVEEALLEMMRRKRAAMANHAFFGGYQITRRQDVKTHTKTPPKKIPSSTEPRRTREERSSSASSSILDSFPLSRSQRSSLLQSNSSLQSPNIFMLSSSLNGPTSPKAHTSRSKHMSTSTVASTVSPSPSPISPPSYTFPLLTLRPIDVNMSPMPSPNRGSLLGATSPSPEPLPSPSTPDTKRSSAEIMFRVASSHRASEESYSLDVAAEGLEEEPKIKATRIVSGHMRRRTASSDAGMISPEGSEFGTGDTIDPALQRKGNRTSIASMSELAKRSSVLSGRGLSCKGHYLNGDKALHHRDAMGQSHGMDARCSVSEDVLAAWGSLGGWRDTQS